MKTPEEFLEENGYDSPSINKYVKCGTFRIRDDIELVPITRVLEQYAKELEEEFNKYQNQRNRMKTPEEFYKEKHGDFSILGSMAMHAIEFAEQYAKELEEEFNKYQNQRNRMKTPEEFLEENDYRSDGPIIHTLAELSELLSEYAKGVAIDVVSGAFGYTKEFSESIVNIEMNLNQKKK